MKPLRYFLAAGLLLGSAYKVFQRVVRREYTHKGRLSPPVSGLQLAILCAYFFFPYVYNPPAWALFWAKNPAISKTQHRAGFALTCLGMAGAFGIMGWFGMKQAFGVANEGLQKSGPYRFSRNPQVVGGALMVIGPALQWPSWYALGWVGMYAAIMHWMVLGEEEHLLRVYGEEYEKYCAEVPRYLVG